MGSDEAAARREYDQHRYAQARARRLEAEARGEMYVAQGIGHGTPHGWRMHNCRCRLCVQAARQQRASKWQSDPEYRSTQIRRGVERRRGYAAELRDAQARGVRHVVEGITHGYAGHNNHKCRCDVCVEAYRVYGAEVRQRRRELRDAAHARGERYIAQGVTHGLSGHRGWYCECDVCREADSAYKRRRKESR